MLASVLSLRMVTGINSFFCCGPISINYSSCATVAEFLGRLNQFSKKKQKPVLRGFPSDPGAP